MKELILLIGGGYIGWWLALNKRKQVELAMQQAIAEAKKQAKQLAYEVRDLTDDLNAEIDDNNRLSELSVTEDVTIRQREKGKLLNSFIDEDY